ncbi:MAG: hypothetical protein IKN43_11770 [Selenomonadaceae bacterium]|nr:hypothetical protein [Selenomonadaceae bacterium]
MRQGYFLQLDIDEFRETMENHCKPIKHLMFERLSGSKIIDDILDHYCEDGYSDILDANKLNDAWFPEIRCDAFISYSHLDVDEAEELSRVFYKYFGLNVFVDSFFWNSCDELQRLIDDKYSFCDEDEAFYDYRKVQYSASHVHLLLIGQLLRVIENCDCFFLLGTPNSLINENGKIQSSSPWIYFETLLYDRLMHTRITKTAGLGSINESVQLKIRYPITKSKMKNLNINDLVKLNQMLCKNCNVSALNLLYDRVFRPFKLIKNNDFYQ